MSRVPAPGVTLRRTWRALVPPGLRKYGQGAAIALAQRRVDAALAGGESAPSPGPLIVSGFINGTKGVSRAARLTIEGLKAADLPVATHDLEVLFSARDESAVRLPVSSPGGVWLMHVNAPEAIAALSRISPIEWLGRYRIGFWAYELPKVPLQWVKAAHVFHEIWAPSQFVSDALVRSGVSRPIRIMPHPVVLGPPPFAHDPRADDFVVLAMGDLRSSATRKNLIGSINIYKRAFPEVSPSRQLILKVQSDDAHPEFLRTALSAAAGRGDIVFRTGSLNDTEIGQLIAAASVLLSPHRSEGFGLTLAEAFLSGVPALATGWSGNIDFMSDTPELLIRYSLTPVRDAAGIYRAAGLQWAEPDIGDAAEKLKTLSQSRELRQQLAARGRAAVQGQLKAWSRQALDEMPIGKLVSAD
ncbi:MAG: glycosyltransferase [Burkholderiales bacterium]|nr:MAG: glycosyltransferase [Burkholderiales bacterium]